MVPKFRDRLILMIEQGRIAKRAFNAINGLGLSSGQKIRLETTFTASEEHPPAHSRLPDVCLFALRLSSSCFGIWRRGN